MLRTLSLALALLVGLAPLARADIVWKVETASSEVVFEYLKDGTPTEGVFRKFEGSGEFDLSAPEDARFELKILTSSIDLFDTIASAFATSAEWFDSKNHPHVTYSLLKLEPVGGNLFAATGEISIRGKTRPLITEIALEIDENTAKAEGTLTIRRIDFLLGVGPGAAFVEIGPDVLVRFNLVARR